MQSALAIWQQNCLRCPHLDWNLETMMRHWILMLALTCALGGCSADTVENPDAALEKPAGGKADGDVIAKLCGDAGKATDCDICEVHGWYSDGVCDGFCANPDLDCGPDLTTFDATCSFANDAGIGDDSSELSKKVVSTRKVTIDDIGSLSELQSRQIWETLRLLDSAPDGEDFDLVFDVADDGFFELHELEIATGSPECVTGKRCGNACISREKTCHLTGGKAYQWVELGLGDTEVGVVFEAQTLKPIARIGDGDLEGCSLDAPRVDDPTPDEPTPDEEFACSFSQTWIAETSGDLDDLVTGEKTVTLDDVDGLSDLQRSQLLAAAVHGAFVEPGADLEVVFDAVDGEEFFLLALSADDAEFDWVQWFAGDTEVGVIFEAGTLHIVAEVGDGDISGCVPAQ
jgi:hypothetical protein